MIVLRLRRWRTCCRANFLQIRCGRPVLRRGRDHRTPPPGDPARQSTPAMGARPRQRRPPTAHRSELTGLVPDDGFPSQHPDYVAIVVGDGPPPEQWNGWRVHGLAGYVYLPDESGRIRVLDLLRAEITTI